MRKQALFILLLVLFAAAVTGCTALQARLEGVPVWTIEKPSNNLTKVFFVGVGETDSLNEMEARELALEDLLTDVSEFLGYDVTETYRRELMQNQAIEEIELQVTEEFVRERDGSITLYILAESNRRTISRLVRANIYENRADESRITGPQNDAQNAYRRQDDYQAFSLYVRAALEAYNSTLADGMQWYEELMEEAVSVLEGMQIENHDSNPGRAVFTARITRGTGLFSPKLGGIPVKAVFPVQNQVGVTRQASLTGHTDSRGVVTFMPKSTIFRGSGTFIMYIDIESELELLAEEVGGSDPHVSRMRKVVTEKRIEIPYTVTSEAAGSTVVTAMLEYDRNGSLLRENSALDTFNTALIGYGFSTNTVDAPADTASEQALLQRVRTIYLQTRSIALIGSVGISALTQTNDTHIASVKGAVRAYNMSDGSVYAESGDLAASGVGPTLPEARQAAFSRFGQVAASIIVGKLL